MVVGEEVVRKAALAWTPLPLRISTALLRVVIKFWGNVTQLFQSVQAGVTKSDINWEAYKQHLLSISGGWEVQGQGAGRVGVWETFLGEDRAGQEEVGRCRAGRLQDRTTEVRWSPPGRDWAGFPCHCRVTYGIGRPLPEALRPLGAAAPCPRHLVPVGHRSEDLGGGKWGLRDPSTRHQPHQPYPSPHGWDHWAQCGLRPALQG